jgi:hypothetical protein
MIKRELHVDKIKANKSRIGPLARSVNGPHANLYDSSGRPVEKCMRDDVHRNRDPRHVVADNWV